MGTAGRRIRIGIVAAAVVGVSVAVSLVILRPVSSRSPADAPTGSPLPSASAAALGLDVLSDGVIHRADGTEVAVGLPDGVTAAGAWAVRSGWVVYTHPRDDLWFASAGAPPRLIGRPAGGYAVSADGRVLSMVENPPATMDRPAVVVAYDLPALTVLGRRVVDIEGLGGAAGTIVVGVSGDRVLLRQIKYLPGMPSAAVWNWRTGSLRGSTAEVLSLSGNGDVLYYVVRPHTPPPPRTGESGTPLPPYGPNDPLPPFCLNVATLADVPPANETGFCTDNYALRQSGTLAPDGSFVALTVGVGDTHATLLVRTAELRAGLWRPVTADLPGRMYVQFWDTKETFVAWGALDDRSTERVYRRCHVSGRCGVVTSPGPPGAVLVVPAGTA